MSPFFACCFMRALLMLQCLVAVEAVAAGKEHRSSLVIPHVPEPLMPQVVRRQDRPLSSSILVDSHGSLSIRSQEVGSHRAAAGLLRGQTDGQPRQAVASPPTGAEARSTQWWNMQASLLAEGKVSHRSEKSRRDLYVLIGSNLCDGGGLWKRYELNAVTPGKYEFCAAACDAKDECLGFDVGNTGCNLYTQKAVAIGTWQSVRSNDGKPFDGEGAHDAFPQTPFDLTVGNTDFGANEKFQCYRKTYHMPPNSYYWLIGNGTCSGGGLWKRYSLSPGNHSSCENACNMRDECVGFDVGKWSSNGSALQVEDNRQSSASTGCFLYTQKAVFGAWPGVEASALENGEDDHNDFPPTPFDLTLGTSTRYNVDNSTQCFGKTHWVNLRNYYFQLGKQLCSGGGRWKHYKMTSGPMSNCKEKCDMQTKCVGLDYAEGGECRLYTAGAVASGEWPGVSFDGNGAFSGSGDHDEFPPTPFSLVPEDSAPSHGKSCFAKTHFEE